MGFLLIFSEFFIFSLQFCRQYALMYNVYFFFIVF